MTKLTLGIRTSALALAAVLLLLVGSALVLPQVAVGQCVDCMVTGGGDDYDPYKDNGRGLGQPGGELDCVDQPEGMTDCQQGHDWCETTGSICQSLMFLRFSESGIASWSEDLDVFGRVAEPDQIGASRLRRTCDGVLLARNQPKGEPGQGEAESALAL